MKVKLDENMPAELAHLLATAGHDASTVIDEELGGSDDRKILKEATAEDRVLMTFDLDFGNIREYPIGTYAGIVVFRLNDQRWAMLEGPALRLVESGVLDLLASGLAVVDVSNRSIRELLGHLPIDVNGCLQLPAFEQFTTAPGQEISLATFPRRAR